jgi:division protein CdvB (Snf7/Vps24/ESCRT-III family)
MTQELNQYDYRFNRVDEAIQKLAGVAADLSKLLAVQDLRLTQQEKITEQAAITMEKRREDFENKVDSIYNTIEEIKTEVNENIEEIEEKLDHKISYIQKLIWMSMGAISIIAFVVELYFGLNHSIK